MKKIISLILILTLSVGFLLSCGSGGNNQVVTPPTNDELIRARISAFTHAYNDGDWENMTACLDKKTRSTFEAMMDIFGSLIDLDLRDLFTLSINLTGTQFAELDITAIEYSCDTEAVVTTESFVYGSTVFFYFVMVKENGGWFISDMTDKKPVADSGNGQNPDGKTAIQSPVINDFVDGLALVKEGGFFSTYWAIINEEGETVFETSYGKEPNLYDHEWAHIGGGVGVSHKIYSDPKDVYEIINSLGEVVVSSLDGEFDSIVCGGGGYAVAYKKIANISSLEHKYGIINSHGEWVIPMRSVGQEDFDGRIKYLGEGMFFIEGAAIINAENGNIIYTNIDRSDLEFKEGALYVFGNAEHDAIYNEDGESIYLPKNYVLYTDGTYEALSENADYYGYTSNGTLCVEYDGKFYIANVRDISDDGQVVEYFELKDYTAETVCSIDFYESDLALLVIRGYDDKMYVSLVDSEANVFFEPVCIGEYYYSSAQYCDGLIICRDNGNIFVLNESGEVVIPSDAGFTEMGPFNDGIAAAIKNSSAVYINDSGEVIISGFYKK